MRIHCLIPIKEDEKHEKEKLEKVKTYDIQEILNTAIKIFSLSKGIRDDLLFIEFQWKYRKIFSY